MYYNVDNMQNKIQMKFSIRYNFTNLRTLISYVYTVCVQHISSGLVISQHSEYIPVQGHTA
jgi:hypothetical protein